MSLLFGFKRFIAAHVYIVALRSVKVKYFDNTRSVMCAEFFGSVNILTRLSPLQLWYYTTARLTAEGPLGPFSSSNITASPSFSVSMPAA